MKIEYVVIAVVLIFASIIIAYRISQKIVPIVITTVKNKIPEKSGHLTKLDSGIFDKDVVAYNPAGVKIYAENNHVYINSPAKKSDYKIIGTGKHEMVITSIAASAENIYIADAGNAEVLIFNYNGMLINKFGKWNDSSNTGFIVPSPYFDVAWDNNRKCLFIANPGTHQIEKYDENGKFISKWGKTGFKDDEFAGCCNPADIAVYKEYIATGEKGSKRVRLFTIDGKYVSTIAHEANFPIIGTTIDLLVTPDGKLLLKDRKSKTIYNYSVK